MKSIRLQVAILLLFHILLFSCQEITNKSTIDPLSNEDTLPSENVINLNRLFNNSSQFVHPGILNSTWNLDEIGSDSNSHRLAGFQKVTDFINNNSIPNSFPSTVYVLSGSSTPSEWRMRTDNILAYAYALSWARTGNSTHATNAKYILNEWAKTFVEIKACTDTDPPPCTQTPSEQRLLQAAWVAPTFAAAAEIIRDYEVGGVGAGWSSNEIIDFENFLIKLHNDYIYTLVSGISPGASGSSWGANNWGASGVWAKMAIAIFVNNSSWYNDAATKTAHLITNAIKTSSGEVNECWRENFTDCVHPQYSLTALTYAAETARIQGDDALYSVHSNKLKSGWEWMSDAYPGPVSCEGESFSCTGSTVYPGVEVANNYYNSSKIESLRDIGDTPYGITTERTFLGFTTYTHHDTNLSFPISASATFNVIEGPGSPSNGSITVSYEQNQVITSYNQWDDPSIVASRIRGNVNADATIQLTAESSGSTVTLTEKRPGSAHNGKNISLFESPDIYIIPDQPYIKLSGGTD